MHVPSPVTPWIVFAWYMAGALLRGLYRFLGWVKEGRKEPMDQVLAEGGQSLILSVVIAFIWTGGHLWDVLGFVGVDLPGDIRVGVTALSSIAAGFFLKLLVAERIVTWWNKPPKGEE